MRIRDNVLLSLGMYAVVVNGGRPVTLALLKESLNGRQIAPSVDDYHIAASSPSEIDVYECGRAGPTVEVVDAWFTRIGRTASHRLLRGRHVDPLTR